ncbi:hypothetical protein [Escherichia coli]|uniref:hypothetical protein n=1 Tax=Escherichia coli TaxID=562 RepID=UPI00207B34A8|nr:hypothetical protein [Escherichia coli]
MSTFGANIGNISYFVFGESEPTQILNKVKNNIIAKNMSWDDVESKYSEDLSLNVLTALRNEIGN